MTDATTSSANDGVLTLDKLDALLAKYPRRVNPENPWHVHCARAIVQHMGGDETDAAQVVVALFKYEPLILELEDLHYKTQLAKHRARMRGEDV